MITINDVRAAAERLRGVAHQTPLDHSQSFSELSGCSLHLKLENMQKTGSFKIRGAYNFIATLAPESKAQGVIAASAGNHAQGVAYAARQSGIAATIVMPEQTPISKVAATRSYGAEVHLYGAVYDDAYRRALELQETSGATLVHAFDDPAVIAGQGTVGTEILDAMPDLDAIVVPVGGGGLIGGIAVAVKAMNPRCRVIGVEAEGAASAAASRSAGEPVTLPSVHTIAEGISVKRPGQQTFALIERYVDDLIRVSDEEIAGSLLLLLERAKLVAEGAGAAALAALLYEKIRLPGQRVAAIVSGGNIDVNFVSRIIETGLVKTGRRVSLQTTLPDRPGNLQQFLRIVADHRANVLSIYQDRMDLSVPLDHVVIRVILETEGLKQVNGILKALGAAGYEAENCGPFIYS